MGIIVALLVIWLIVVVLGIVIHGIFWLAIIGLILFVLTGGFGFVRNRR